jgi:hypothetical protein
LRTAFHHWCLCSQFAGVRRFSDCSS